MPAATCRHCLVASRIPGGAVDPVGSATPPRSSFFARLAAAKLKAMYFRVPVARDISLDKRLEMFAESGDAPPVFTFTHTS